MLKRQSQPPIPPLFLTACARLSVCARVARLQPRWFCQKKKRLLTDWHEMRGVGVIRSLEKKGEGREAFREGQCD